MIKQLLIKNYALIENISFQLKSGFSVVSGETGAGKSIMLDAISLLCGKRADKSSLFNKDNKCVIEGVFIFESENKNLFELKNLDFDIETIIRREIAINGKSRAFINDTPVSLSDLKEITSQVVEIYAQHQSILLKEEKKQLQIIDSFAKNDELKKDYLLKYSQYNTLLREIKNFEIQGKISNSEIDFITFQIKELEESFLKENEKEELEESLKILENAEDITEVLNVSDQLLNSENSVLSFLSEIEAQLNKINNFSSEISLIAERISSVRIELDDIQSEIKSINSLVEVNPHQLSECNNRLNQLNTLLLKHKKNDVSELIVVLSEFKDKVKISYAFDKLISEKEEELKIKKDLLIKSSFNLRKSRLKSIPIFSDLLVSNLKKLGIKDAKFEIDLTEKEDFSISGNDLINFLFSANRGSNLNSISKVASGGELSRLMLSISYLCSDNNKVNCLIFDEIDSGVSGEIADLMAEMMLKMSENCQIISITHLPQIASKSDSHLLVYKEVVNNSTISKIKELKTEERISEIAKMLSGKKVSESAIENAKQLLNL